MRTKRRLKKKKIIFMIVELMFVILIIFSSIKIFKWYRDNKKNNEILTTINNDVKIIIDKDTKEKTLDIDFNNLIKRNSDTVAY